MIGVQDEQEVDRLLRQEARLVFLAGRREKHVQEIRPIAQVVAGIHDRLAFAVLVCGRGDRGCLGDDPVGGDLPLVRVVKVMSS